ncbi:putative two-component system response regulator [Inhella inkyongensis]|uniref:Putative two-component system response regulator n=1 Tax=Inhella inkyongensis TaxID=392593 RepID=A0A840S541_9BURK|nr:HD domain-containing phosphohydrolase [Inhella inkyongensis]MBB5204682.1 putative two-component system response regulator [Inhella inkyongensis]
MNIVIVDDNLVNVALLRGLVRQIEGAQSVEFTDPRAGLEHVLRTDVDLLIVDYQMPELDGLDFVRILRSDTSKQDLPVLMVTADHEMELRHRALQLGANDFLTKPVDRVEFQARTRNMLALRRSQRALSERAVSLATEVALATDAIVARELDTILRLSKAAEYRDPETGAHVMRMAHYARLIALQLGLPEAEQELLLHAAPMHDIGKVGTPDHILLKPGRLSPEELVIMRQHARIGHDILADSASPYLQAAAMIALHHHERWDGQGYPLGLAGEAISLWGRIVAVADVFDALSSERPYKAAWTLEAARDFLLEHAGAHFDPRCVQAFVEAWDQVLEVRQRFQDEPPPPAESTLMELL